MKPLHSTILASAGGVLAALGLASTVFSVLLPVGGLLFLIGMTSLIGQLSFPEERRPIRLLFGLLGTLALLSSVGTTVYYLYTLNALGWSWIFIATPWAVFALSPFVRSSQRQHAASTLGTIDKATPEDSLSGVLLLIAIAADLAAVRFLFGARSGEALRTPWEVVSPTYFLWIGLATFCLLALAYRRRYPHLTLAAGALHLFAMLSPAALVYAVGFGFDPFVHQAAERLVAAAGEITPKTPYYIGQYALVAAIAKLSGLSIETVDRFLLPSLTAVFLPTAAAWLLRRGYGVPRPLALIGAFGTMLLPLGVFAVTTPQGLANLFFLLTLLLGAAWLHGHRPPLAFVLLLGAASAATHPLVGIPALCAVALLAIVKLRHDEVIKMRLLKSVAFAATVMITALAVPVVFAFRDGSGYRPIETALTTPIPELLASIPFETPGLESRFQPILDFAEFATRNHDFLFVLLAAAGAWLLIRRKGYRRSALAAGGLSAALFVSVAILKNGFVFRDVIDYEQGNYADRLYEAALLSLAPLALAGFAWWWRALAKADQNMRVFHSVLLAAASAALVYGAFPRLDDYRYSRGYSTSVHDLHAVEWINNTGTAPYVVLANQSVSAAALHAFGFKTYFGSQFYYSIPTGAPLYRSYLSMVYDGAERETMDAAMRDMKVPTAYFVINRYWTNADRIVAEAKKTADDWQEIDGGDVYVFRYVLR